MVFVFRAWVHFYAHFLESCCFGGSVVSFYCMDNTTQNCIWPKKLNYLLLFVILFGLLVLQDFQEINAVFSKMGLFQWKNFRASGIIEARRAEGKGQFNFWFFFAYLCNRSKLSESFFPVLKASKSENRGNRCWKSGDKSNLFTSFFACFQKLEISFSTGVFSILFSCFTSSSK